MRVNLENNLNLSQGSPFASQDPVITVIAMAILVPVCLWVYYDARGRYRSPWAPFLWAMLVFLVLIFFLPVYLITRPPKNSPADKKSA